MPAGDCPPSGRHDARASLSTARTPQCQGHSTERGQLQDLTRPTDLRAHNCATPGALPVGATRLAQQAPSRGPSAKKFAQQAQKHQMWGVVAHWASFFAHRAQRRGGFETNDTSAATDVGQHETSITTARPQTATIETAGTSATQKHATNTHFSPAKVPLVSAPQRAAPNRKAHPFTHQHTRRRRCGGRRRDLPRCRWAVAGPGRASRRRAERSSRRGRLAGGPPPTGTHSGRALRRPEHPWGNKHQR